MISNNFNNNLFNYSYYNLSNNIFVQVSRPIYYNHKFNMIWYLTIHITIQTIYTIHTIYSTIFLCRCPTRRRGWGGGRTCLRGLQSGDDDDYDCKDGVVIMVVMMMMLVILMMEMIMTMIVMIVVVLILMKNLMNSGIYAFIHCIVCSHHRPRSFGQHFITSFKI